MYQSKMKSEETDHLFKAILSLKTEEECYRFFDDLCTFSEIQAMTQRLQVAEMLEAGNTFSQISKEIGVSSARQQVHQLRRGRLQDRPQAHEGEARTRISLSRSDLPLPNGRGFLRFCRFH